MPANRIYENVCGFDITVNEARELFRRAVLMANQLKAVTGISAPLTFVKAEGARILFQNALDELSGDELSRIRGTVLAKTVLPNIADLCARVGDVWLTGNDFSSTNNDPLVQARDQVAEWTQQIKANHLSVSSPTVAANGGGAAQIVLDTPVDDSSGLGVKLAVGGAVAAVLGLGIWYRSRA